MTVAHAVTPPPPCGLLAARSLAWGRSSRRARAEMTSLVARVTLSSRSDASELWGASDGPSGAGTAGTSSSTGTRRPTADQSGTQAPGSNLPEHSPGYTGSMSTIGRSVAASIICSANMDRYIMAVRAPLSRPPAKCSDNIVRHLQDLETGVSACSNPMCPDDEPVLVRRKQASPQGGHLRGSGSRKE